MSRQLREIAGRRRVLASRSKYARREIAYSGLWSSVPFLLTELFLDSSKAIWSGSRRTRTNKANKK